jgi:hypothetical protein
VDDDSLNPLIGDRFIQLENNLATATASALSANSSYQAISLINRLIGPPLPLIDLPSDRAYHGLAP